MISPESLGPKAKKFLLRRYELDVEDRVRFHRRDRLTAMFLWILPLLAVGLFWGGAIGSTSYKLIEFVAWCFVGFVTAADLFLWIYIWKQTEVGPLKPNHWWYLLFRNRIRPPSPPVIRVIAQAGAWLFPLAAAATGHVLLAAAWLISMVLGRARRRSETKRVRGALDRIDRYAPPPAPGIGSAPG